jgi:hypothetical protein
MTGGPHKRIEIRIFTPGNKNSKLHIVQAAPGRTYPDAQIDKILETFADNLETAAPNEEYELVDVGPGRFNFVWRATKAAPAAGLMETSSE